jgi:hypothetical protein
MPSWVRLNCGPDEAPLSWIEGCPGVAPRELWVVGRNNEKNIVRPREARPPIG